MAVTIRFETDNSAMRDAHDDVDIEAVAKAIRKVATEIERDGVMSGVVMDANGNTVGAFDVDED